MVATAVALCEESPEEKFPRQFSAEALRWFRGSYRKRWLSRFVPSIDEWHRLGCFDISE